MYHCTYIPNLDILNVGQARPLAAEMLLQKPYWYPKTKKFAQTILYRKLESEIILSTHLNVM